MQFCGALANGVLTEQRRRPLRGLGVRRTSAASSLRGERWPLSSAVGNEFEYATLLGAPN
jgi:hypothetical protein